ncbi:MAG: ceramidase domain-containing protein [Pseudomonadota bacterium]
MNDAIDIYCERLSPEFWAEPINAMTNASFFIAAALILWMLRRSPDTPTLILAILTICIGVGSFLFHTFAVGWAALSDVVPIALFISLAVGVALHRQFDISVRLAVAGALAFTLLAPLVGLTPLDRLIPSGSVAYIPALLALTFFAGVALWRRRAEAPALTAAAVTFGISLFLRSVDIAVCEAFPLGTHFLWHMFNAVTLYLVMRGLWRAGQPRTMPV